MSGTLEYDLIRSERKTLSVEIRDGRVLIRAPLRTPVREIEAFLGKNRAWIDAHLADSLERQRQLEAVPKLSPDEIRALAERAREYIPQRVAYYAPLVGVSCGRITIRKQRTKWGSCSSEGNLSFNCLLMLAPDEVIDSVVVHELCHLKEMNHSERFYAEVLRVFPDYRAQHEWLKANGARIMAMAE